jgi:hypothetical protein
MTICDDQEVQPQGQRERDPHVQQLSSNQQTWNPWQSVFIWKINVHTQIKREREYLTDFGFCANWDAVMGCSSYWLCQTGG